MEKGVPIRSITRAIAALKAINRLGSMSMMEISRTCQVPYPTACRIVQTLLYEELIEQEPARKRYRPAALVQALAHGFQPDDWLVNVARPHIEALTARLGWPVSIAIRIGGNVMVRDSTHASASLTFEHYHPGFTLPLLESASGKLTIAYAPDEERLTILKWMRMSGDFDPDDLRSLQLSVDVEKIRRLGYAVQGRNNFNLTPGKTFSIAVPIFDGSTFKAAMTMVFFVKAMTIQAALENHLEGLKAVAAAISDDLIAAGTQGGCVTS